VKQTKAPVCAYIKGSGDEAKWFKLEETNTKRPRSKARKKLNCAEPRVHNGKRNIGGEFTQDSSSGGGRGTERAGERGCLKNLN